MMERLTIDEVIEHCNKTCDMTEKIAKARGHELESIESNQFWEHYQVRAWLKELKQYKDLEEQGLLLRLPCHIGDIIYEPTNRNTINEYIVTGIRKEAFALWIEWKLEKGFVYQSIYGVEVEDIGKTVFLTQAEAEQKLKEMESD